MGQKAASGVYTVESPWIPHARKLVFSVMTSVDPQFLERFLRENGPALLLYARQWCDTPEDVLQEALMRLAEQARLPDSPKAWMYRAVRNGAISAARKASRRSRHERAASHRTEPWFTAPEGQRLDAAAATRALRQLPIQQREVIVARLWGGLSLGEIAKLNGSSSSTVGRRYQAGLSALRERLKVSCPQNSTTPD